MERTGGLFDSDAILGPFGTYFGRTIGDVRDRLVWWTVPYSGGRRIQVNVDAYPAFQEVATKLAEHGAAGRVYPITSVSGFVPRTIGGARQLSRHGLGLAIDINPAQNPHRLDNVLITNMPDWFVDTFREAGFCWGGDWKYSKDAMHYSYMGPGSHEGTGGSLSPIAPKTANQAYLPVATHPTLFAGALARYQSVSVADGSGNGAPDVLGVRPHPDGAVIDVTSSTRAWNQCSVLRWLSPSPDLAEGDFTVALDLDGDSRQDVAALRSAAGTVEATTATRRGDYEDVSTQTTGVDPSAVAVTGADFDEDRIADLWHVGDTGVLEILAGPAWTTTIHSKTLPGGAPLGLAAGDRDGGNQPELFALYADPGGIRVEVLRFTGGQWVVEDVINSSLPASQVKAIGANDYDGDGRTDFQILDDGAALRVYVGNTSTGESRTAWFIHTNLTCSDPVVLAYNGFFYDDDNSIFESEIESIATVGVTKGCNPPFNDQFCPKDIVTRETMAAFLRRALGLAENTHPGFVDVIPGSTFEADIGKLATAGVTRGCNPPVNDRFCPSNLVTRETMAAFLVRALGLTENTHPGFTDVPASSIFAQDIGRLATAGITKGCNPPANDQFCPKQYVTREVMAAMLDRAGLGS